MDSIKEAAMTVDKIIQDHLAVIGELSTTCLPDIDKFARCCQQAILKENRVFFCGNGGSAADSQHLAAEFVGRFQKERRGLAAIALTTDTSILTAVGNDYGYDQIFARQVEALTKPGDIVVGITTSGNSPNIVAAIEAAKAVGAVTVGMTGKGGGKLAALCDVCVKVPSDITARIQEAHILIGHIVCQLVDEVSERV